MRRSDASRGATSGTIGPSWKNDDAFLIDIDDEGYYLISYIMDLGGMSLSAD